MGRLLMIATGARMLQGGAVPALREQLIQSIERGLRSIPDCAGLA